MRRLDPTTPANGSSGHDAVDINSYNFGNHSCFTATDNTSSATCINDATFGDNGFLLDMEYYYYDDDAGWDFFDIYYSTTRFAVETTMALLSMTLNVLDSGEDQNCRGKTTFSWSQTILVTRSKSQTKALAITS